MEVSKMEVLRNHPWPAMDVPWHPTSRLDQRWHGEPIGHRPGRGTLPVVNITRLYIYMYIYIYVYMYIYIYIDLVNGDGVYKPTSNWGVPPTVGSKTQELDM